MKPPHTSTLLDGNCIGKQPSYVCASVAGQSNYFMSKNVRVNDCGCGDLGVSKVGGIQGGSHRMMMWSGDILAHGAKKMGKQCEKTCNKGECDKNRREAQKHPVYEIRCFCGKYRVEILVWGGRQCTQGKSFPSLRMLSNMSAVSFGGSINPPYALLARRISRVAF